MTALMLAVLAATPPPEPVRRLAVLVGANAAPAGRTALHHAHRDARRLRDALVRVGGVAEEDAALLLDPAPGEVLAALEQASARARGAAGESVLTFYYSGHADQAALYPGGRALPIAEVRRALLEGGATVKVGIFDACRGGAWTRAKGLTPDAPVELREPWTLAAEGTVLFASSSGLESAHESDRLQGSFFTHHLVGGLLGAADASGDGQVTATEAFQYAQAQTVRDSARASLEPQHPSFELNLHGRTDLVLARLAAADSTLAVEQSAGPLQVVELPLGLVLLELPEGKRSSRLSVAPGAYLVRRVDEQGVVTAREVAVAAGQVTTIEESSLTLVGEARLERKGAAEEPPLPATQETLLPAHTMEASLRLGVQYQQWDNVSNGVTSQALQAPPSLDGWLDFTWAPLDWLQVSFLTPGLSFLLGTRHQDEVVLHAGLGGWSFGNLSPYVTLTVAGGAVERHWFSPRTSLAAFARWHTLVEVVTDAPRGSLPHHLEGGVMLSHTLGGLVSFNFAVSALGWVKSSFGLALGSGKLGYRTFPLLRVHLTPVWSLDLDVRVTLQLQPGLTLGQEYLAGATATF